MFWDIQACAYNSVDFYSYDTTPVRTVNQYEIEIFEKGAGATFVNGVRYPHISINLLFAKHGDLRFTTGKSKCKLLKFKCDDKSVCKVLDALPSGAIMADCDELIKIIDKTNPIVNSDDDYDKMNVYSNICSAIAVLHTILNSHTGSFKKSDDRYIDEIILTKEYIDNNYGAKINLETLSRLTFLSRNFLRVKFSELIGISPHDYLTKVRIANAKKLLAQTDTLLADIAIMCGFDSQSYFNYSFKKEVGVSPLYYRNENKK